LGLQEKNGIMVLSKELLLIKWELQQEINIWANFPLENYQMFRSVGDKIGELRDKILKIENGRFVKEDKC
jgi:hypothetical protein